MLVVQQIFNSNPILIGCNLQCWETSIKVFALTASLIYSLPLHIQEQPGNTNISVLQPDSTILDNLQLQHKYSAS